MKNSAFQTSRKGFTLTDLMVVIGVGIALMIPLASVALNSYEKGRAVNCMGNLRQISQGIELFVIENRRLPSDSMSLRGQLADFVANGSVFTCPSARTIGDDSYQGSYLETAQWGSKETSYMLTCSNHAESNLSVLWFSTLKGGVGSTGSVTVSGQRSAVGSGATGTGKVIQFEDGSTVELLDDKSMVEIVQSAKVAGYPRHTVVKQTSTDGTKGEIRVTVAPGSRFFVITPALVAGVRGTQFTVSASYAGDRHFASVAVVSGSVAVHERKPNGGFRLLLAGQRVDVSTAADQIAPPVGESVVNYGGQNYCRVVTQGVPQTITVANYYLGTKRQGPVLGTEKWEEGAGKIFDKFAPND